MAFDFLTNRPRGVPLHEAIKAWLELATLTLLNKTLTSPTINGATIGTSTLTDPRIGEYIKDVNGNSIIQLAPAANAVTHVQIANSASATTFIKVVGAGSHLNLNVQPKGANGVTRFLDGIGLSVFQTVAGVASAVNYTELSNAATGNSVIIRAAGSDTDAGLRLTGKGAFGAEVVEAIATKTANYTATVHDTTILCDATAGAVTVALPAASTMTGRTLNVKKIDASANAVTIDPNGAELVDGASTKDTTTQWVNIPVVSNGTAWFSL